jgi:hypothetical protein
MTPVGEFWGQGSVIILGDFEDWLAHNLCAVVLRSEYYLGGFDVDD